MEALSSQNRFTGELPSQALVDWRAATAEEHDFVAALRWILAHPALDGPVNVAAPHPLPYRDFMRALRRAAGVPIGLPATRWMVEVAALLLRTETELVLKSRRVVPGRLLASGFAFAHPTWEAAARELVGRRAG